MEAYFLIAVSGILGLLLGTNTRIRNSFGRILLNNKNYSNPNNRYFINKKRFIPTIEFAKCNFDEKELRFLNQLIYLKKDSKGVSIDFLNSIIDPEKINHLNNRLARNNFLNDLNLKLFLIYGVEEVIVSKGTAEDRRKKSYFLNHHLASQLLENDFEVKFKQLISKNV